MTLWIQPLFGDPYALPFSPPDPASPDGWRPVYEALSRRGNAERGEETALHQLCLLHGDTMDLSGVKEGDVLRLVVTERMVERWVSEYSLSKEEDTHTIWHSTMCWWDGRWGDPYEKPSISYRTPLTLHVVLRVDHATGLRAYQTQPNLIQVHEQEREWYPTLREALRAFQIERDHGAEMTDTTLEHLHRLWSLYHGTYQHLVDQGRWYM